MINSLFEKSCTIINSLADWQKEAFEAFEAKMNDTYKPFPCIPAVIGFTKNELRYGFVGDPREESSSLELGEMLTSYSEQYRSFGNYTSLIIFFKTPEELRNSYNAEQFEQLFWHQLSSLATLDNMEWPKHIPEDPHHSLWEFCFHGEQYFMYCATPAHKNRQSRYFPNMMFAITPRRVLQEFNKKPTFAERMKIKIRERLGNYDKTGIHPSLNTYGEIDNLEWKQYFLRDDESVPIKCPYHRVLKALRIQEKDKKK